MVLFPTNNGESFSFDDNLLGNLKVCADSIKRDMDHVFVISGQPRTGKSSFAHQMAFILSTWFNRPYNLNPQTCFTPEALLKAVQYAKQYDVIIYDEGMTGLSSRESMSKTNKVLQRMFAECGQKNLFIFVLIPDFFSLDSFVALHRSRCLIQVYFGDNFTRGNFAFFSHNKKRELYFVGKKLHNPKAIRPDFYGKFVSLFPFDDATYRQMKLDALKAHTIDGEDNLNTGQKFNSLLYWLVKDKVIPYKDISDGLLKYGMNMREEALRQAVSRFNQKQGGTKDDRSLDGKGEV